MLVKTKASVTSFLNILNEIWYWNGIASNKRRGRSFNILHFWGAFI